MENDFKFTAVGDCLISRRLPPNDPAAATLRKLMAGADARFANLETVVRRGEGHPAAQSGGTWTTTPPEALEDLRAFGFNLLGWATNHTLDYSIGGLLATRDYLNAGGWVHAGAGAELAEAAAPAYLETPSGTVALIAATASFHPSWIAGKPRPGVSGRPGVNPLRSKTKYLVSSAELEQLRQIAAACGINATHLLRVKEGFAHEDEDGVVRFGNLLFEEARGCPPGEQTMPHKGDLQRLAASIREAAERASIVLVSLHAHAMREGRKELAADFITTAARACIDAGAHAVIGHGPHILRGVEVYQSRPIFLSLGDFIFQNDTVAVQPADFYEKYNVPLEADTATAFAARSANDTRGLGVNPKVWHSVVACWQMRGGQLHSMEFHPVTLHPEKPPAERGWPAPTETQAPLQELVELSAPLGTNLVIEGNRAVWRK